MTVIRRILPGITGLAVSAAMLAGVTAANTGSAGAATTSPGCGAAVYKATGTRWACTWDDEFSGSSLDASKWTPYTSVAGGFQGGGECYSPSQVRVSGGTLRLPTARALVPFNCAGHTATYRSGMVVSKQKFTQTYGRFEIRAKIPMSKGLHSAFWLLPESSYNAAGQLDYGEIDVMEAGGGFKDIASPHLHYVLTPGTPQTGAYCSVPNMATQFHTYTLEWTTSSMRFSYDGKTCWTTTWQPIAGYQPAGAHAPAPFDQPFYILLNMGIDTAATIPANAISSLTDVTQPMQVDYIRVWR